MAHIRLISILAIFILACLVHYTETSEQTEHQTSKQRHRQQQAHWNQKHNRQHGNYKKQIQHQRQSKNTRVVTSQQNKHQTSKQRQRQHQGHWNQKHNRQHGNYKKQIEHQRQSYRRQPSYNKKQPVYHYKKKYHYKKRKYKYIKWPRIRGRCKYSPWTVGGSNPVMEEAAKGNMVFLFLLKANDPYSYKQLFKMNDMAEHYDSIGTKITLMALAHRSRQIPDSYRRQFPYIKFYQEPASEDLYTLLRANYRYNIIYDQCGRQQYHFSPPYSWLGFEFTRLAIDNVRKFHTDYHLCGVCKPPPTTIQPASTTNSNTNSSVPTTTRRPPITKASQEPVDGPYTNIPVAAAKH